MLSARIQNSASLFAANRATTFALTLLPEVDWHCFRISLRAEGGKMKRTESAGGIVINRRGEILVVSQHGTSWSLPKGRIEEGEDKLAAARREIHEESGITRLELIEDLGSYERFKLSGTAGEDRSELKTIHMFVFTTDEEELNPIDPENPEAIWTERTRVVELLTHPKDREFFLREFLKQ
jgi:8-oxo-dGTP pyrophosphatase MutT (NUDIX family)